MTFLRDDTLFVPTGQIEQGRKVYKKIDADELYYVDNLHHGADAHIEIFNSKTRKQIAVSRVDKIDKYRKLTEEEKRRTI